MVLMSNPIFSSQNQNTQSNGIFGMIDQIRNSPDPNTAMQNLVSSNPRVQEVIQYVNQNGGNARAAFYNLAGTTIITKPYPL